MEKEKSFWLSIRRDRKCRLGLPSAAQVLTQHRLPEELTPWISESTWGMAVADWLHHCRRPIQVRSARKGRLVSVMGSHVFNVRINGQISVRRWSRRSSVTVLVDSAPAHCPLTTIIQHLAFRHPAWDRLFDCVRAVDTPLPRSPFDTLLSFLDEVVGQTLTNQAEAILWFRVSRALNIDPFAWKQAIRLASNLRGSFPAASLRDATLEDYNRVLPLRQHHLAVSTEAPCLLPLLDHYGDLLALEDEPKQGLRRLMTQAGIRPKLWRMFHRMEEPERVGHLLTELLEMVGAHSTGYPRTLLHLLLRAQAVAGRNWPNHLLLLAGWRVVAGEGFDGVDGDEALSSTIDWAAFDRLVPVLALIQRWCEAGQVIEPSDMDVPLKHFELWFGNAWIQRGPHSMHLERMVTFYNRVIDILRWAQRMDAAVIAKRFGRSSWSSLCAAVEASHDEERHRFMAMPGWTTPFRVDLNRPDVQAVVLNSPVDMLDEGRRASNCLAQMWPKAAAGESIFVSLRATCSPNDAAPTSSSRHPGARPLALLEIGIEGSRVNLLQVRGFANSQPSPEMARLARQCAWQVRRQHWQRLTAMAQDACFEVQPAAA